MRQTVATDARQRVNVRSVALPSEHGAWGFFLEPVVLGFLLAVSWRGLLLAVAALGIFLIHQPIKIAVKDRLKGRRSPRTVLAERLAIGYGLLTIVPLLILVWTTSPPFLLPLALALPFVGLQLYYDAHNQSRRLMPEVCGAAALAMIAPSITVLGGWDIVAALLLWLLLILRAITSIVYIRARLKLEHGKAASSNPVWLIHTAALLLVIGLAVIEVVPALSILAFALLLARAWLGLSHYRQARPARIIGFQEIVYGLVTVFCVALGYRV